MNTKCFEVFNVLETERLILREVSKLDVEEIYQIFSDEEVAKYDWFEPIESQEEARKIIDVYKEEFEAEEEITWGIALKETNKLVGICCLCHFEPEARRAEIGYDLMQSEWNKGYATEMVKAIVDFGFNYINLNRIESFITPGNHASVKVLEKAGFTKEGVVRERDFIKNKLEDGVIMAILQKDIVK